MQRTGGFTIIELMITIAVLAIISAMAAPYFSSMVLKQNLNKSTRDLIAVLQEARAQAVMERRDVTVSVFNPTATLPPNTVTQFNWRPFGKTVLRNSSATTITFVLTGGVKNANADTTFALCMSQTENTGRTISISRMGTVQQVVEGTCS